MSAWPVEALCAIYRSEKDQAAAEKRGLSVPGSYALRVHSARMMRKARSFLVDAGFCPPDKPEPVKERETPLTPAKL